MPYMPELLSEQIAVTNLTGAITTNTTKGIVRTTGAADLRENHRFRVRAILVDHSTTTGKATGKGTKTVTATASATAVVTGVLKVQVATNTKFVGATTLSSLASTFSTKVTATAKVKTGTVTATATAIAIGSMGYEATGEIVQAKRIAEDRYLRAFLTVKGGAGVMGIEEDCSRYKPNP